MVCCDRVITLRAGAAVFLVLLAALAAFQSRAQTPEGGGGGGGGGGLGLCPPNAGRLDGYVQALCAGESALKDGDVTAAMDRFRFAAALPRAEATNELAWAGLAAAHCRSREIDAGRQWAAHFAQARQLWLGELDCTMDSGDPRARLSPFVSSRMCSERLAADYELVRANPQATYAIDLRTRLRRIDDAIAEACAMDAMSQPQPEAGAQAGNSSGKKETAKAPTRRAAGKSARSRAEKKQKPG
jgi:hypothetical protein